MASRNTPAHPCQAGSQLRTAMIAFPRPRSLHRAIHERYYLETNTRRATQRSTLPRRWHPEQNANRGKEEQ